VGNLGDGAATTRTRPVAVAGGLRFLQVNAGGSYTCGVTTDNRAYCWGDNSFGQLGDGTQFTRLKPVPVAGGHRFHRVDAGLRHTCGLTTEDRVFCWGDNLIGQLGIGTDTGPEICGEFSCSTRPIAVAAPRA
jgi:alpha-tubulin suppressor-like RCC1 family protein